MLGDNDKGQTRSAVWLQKIYAIAKSAGGTVFYGKVTTATSDTQFKVDSMAGLGTDLLNSAYYCQVIQADATAPEGEIQKISAYDTSDGDITVESPYTVAPSIDDYVLILHESALGLESGGLQSVSTTIDLNQAAADYTLLTGSVQTVTLEALTFKMPNVDISGGALTSISIHSDDVTPDILISASLGTLSNLTQEASLTWTGAIPVKVGTIIQLTIAGGAGGVACVCDISAQYRINVTGGILS